MGKKHREIVTSDSTLFLESVFSRINSGQLSGVREETTTILSPLLSFDGLPNNAKDKKIHSIVKELFPFLSKVLKCCFEFLGEDSRLQIRGAQEELLSLAAFCIQCFRNIRFNLRGRFYEVELHQYNLLRKFVGLRMSDRAIKEAWSIFQSLSMSMQWQLDKDDVQFGVRLKKDQKADWVLLPRFQEGIVDPDLTKIIVGVVCSLLSSFADKSVRLAHRDAERLIKYVDDLDTWTQNGDTKARQANQDSLFGALFKITARILSSSSLDSVSEEFLSSTFSACLLSSNKKNFPQIVQKLTNETSTGIQGDALMSMKIFFSAIKLCIHDHSATASEFHFLDLTNKCVKLAESREEKAAAYSAISIFVTQLNKKTRNEINSCASLHLVTLGLELSCEAKNPKQGNLPPILEKSGIKGLALRISEIETELERNMLGMLEGINMTEGIDPFERQIWAEYSKSFDFLRRAANLMAKKLWASYLDSPVSAQGNGDHFVQSICCSLFNLLQFSWPNLKYGQKIVNASDKDKVMPWHISAAVSTMSTCARLSCLDKGKLKDHFRNTLEFACSGLVVEDDFKWLLSSIHNMGVELFNRKRNEEAKPYFLFCYRAKSAHFASSDPTSRVEELSSVFSELGSCCKVYLENLLRCNEFSMVVSEAEITIREWAWIAQHSRGEDGPRMLVRFWIRSQLSLIDETCQDEKLGAKSIAKIVSVLEDCSPRLEETSFGILMEEVLSCLSQVEATKSELCQSAAIILLSRALSKTDFIPQYSLFRARFLLEQSRISRMLPDCEIQGGIQFVDEAILLLNSKSNCHSSAAAAEKLSMKAAAYCYKALISAEHSPKAKIFLSDIDKAIQCWEELTQEADMQGMQFDSVVHLALSAADLLSLEGNVKLQSRAIGVALNMALRAESTGLFWKVAGYSRLSHALCPVYASDALVQSSLEMGNFDMGELAMAIDSQCKDSPLHVWYLLTKECKSESELEGKENIVLEIEREMANKSRRSVWHLLLHGSILHQLAGNAQVKGNIPEAMKYALEGLKMRYSLVNYMFKENKPEGEKSEAQMSLELKNEGKLLSLPTNSNPGFAKQTGEDILLHPSQWRVLSDYFESLFQCGKVSELSGMVDDSERHLKEGKILASSMGFLFLEAKFTLALAEITKKKSGWELSEERLAEAQTLMESCEPAACCELCLPLLHAAAQTCNGDLIQAKSEPCQQNSFEALHAAMEFYDNAQSMLNLKEAIAEDLSLRHVPRGDSLRQMGVKRELLFTEPSLTETDQKPKGEAEELNEAVLELRGDLERLSLGSIESFNTAKTNFSEADREMGAPRKNVSVRRAKGAALKEAQNVSEKKLAPKCSKETVKNGKENGLSLDNEEAYRKAKSRTGRRQLQRNGNLLPSSAVESSLDSSGDSGGVKFKRTVRKAGKQRKAIILDSDSDADDCTIVNMEVLRSGVETCENSSPSGDKTMVAREMRSNCDKENLGGAKNSGIEALRNQIADFHSHDGSVGPNSASPARRTNVSKIGMLMVQHGMPLSEYSKKSSQVLTGEVSNGLEQWIWDREQRRLLSHILVQKGNCFLRNWQLKESNVCFEAAVDFSQGPGPALCPTELAMSLIAMSKLSISMLADGSARERKQISLSSITSKLREAMSLCSGTPLLYKEVCMLLAVLHSQFSSNLSIPQPLWSSEVAQPWLAAYFHSLSVGCTVRHQFRSQLDSKIDSEPGKDSLARGSFVKTRAQLIPGSCPSTEPEAELAVSQWMESLPPGTAACILSQVNLTDCGFKSREEEPEAEPDWQSDDLSSCLMITRLCHGRPPITLILPPSKSGFDAEKAEECSSGEEESSEPIRSGHSSVGSVLAEFKAIMNDSKESTVGWDKVNSQSEKVDWWERRLKLDSRLELVLTSMEEGLFGVWRFAVLPDKEDDLSAVLEERAEVTIRRVTPTDHCASKARAAMASELLRLLLRNSFTLSKAAIRTASERIVSMARGPSSVNIELDSAAEALFEEVMSARVKLMNPSKASHKQAATGAPSLPFLLILDAKLQALPWESVPVLRGHTVYRMPCLLSASALAMHHKLLGSSKGGPGVSHELSSFPAVDPSRAFFVLNPSEDLKSTQSEFENWFYSIPDWKGVVGRIPSADECLSEMQERDLFVYCGHGSGEQYIPGRSVRRLPKCSAAFLMGCSSGKLSDRGEYEPWGAPLSYILAGSPFVIANLWDVTDKDIDRFSKSVLQKWTSFDIPSANKKTSKRAAKKSSTNGEAEWMDMNRVPEGRLACKLPFLIGASPVCYGIPTMCVTKGHE